MAQSKATKKFESRHLKDTLKRRKDFAKVKQRHHVKDKRKARQAEDSGKDQGGADSRPQKKQKQTDEQLQDMSVDDFFAGGFQIPEDKMATLKAKTSKSKESVKKRKRQEPEEDEGEDLASGSDEMGANAFADEDEQEPDIQSDDGVDAENHANELKALAKKDPEFYKYLQENDAELLNFAETADLDEVDDLSGSDTDTKSNRRKGKQSHEEGGNISKATVQKWVKSMTEQHSLRAMREIVLAFRAAAHLNEEDKGQNYKYTISNADVYHEVVVGALQHVSTVLNHHLPVKQLPNGRMRLSTDSKKFRNLTPLLKSHTVSIQHLLSNLSDSPTIRRTLSSILELTPYILSFKKAVRELIRAVVEIWSSSAQPETIRISAFLILRRLSVISDAGLKETLLRTTYQGLIKSCRTTTTHNLPAINLMKNSAVELWGLVDHSVAYTTSFTLIRQLAIHLRTSLKNNANDSYKAVYNWQYVHSLDFWSRVLSTHCETLREASSGKPSPLRPLIYPLTQVTLGAMRLIPTSAYFPLRFHLIRALIRISATTNTYIPLAAALYEVLQSAEMKKPPKPSTLKSLDFETSIRAGKQYLRTRVYQDGVGEQVVELMSEFLGLWCKNIAFPELALPVVVMLKRWGKDVNPFDHRKGGRPQVNGAGAGGKHGRKGKGGKAEEAGKGNRNAKLNTAVSLLVQKLEANSRFIEEKRAKVEFAPNDRAGVEGFLKELEPGKTPLGAFVEGQRKQREERRRIVEEGRREEGEKRDKEKDEGEGEIDPAFEGSSDEGGESDVELDDEMEGEEGMEEEWGDDDDEPMLDGEDEEEAELEDDEVEVIES